MKIAILVWGSLYWEPRNLATTNEWFYDGPILPIEFARISNGNRLTLVITPSFNNVQTLYAISTFKNLGEARENLRNREGTPNIDNIGFIDFIKNDAHVRESNNFVIDIIDQWNATKNFDAILWSDFQPIFTERTNQAFTLENILSFIGNLSDEQKRSALQYIRNTPQQITTRFRNEIEKHFIDQKL